MAIEIERKYLVKSPPLHLAEKRLHIKQGYIVNDQKQVIRIREKGDEYFLTIKGNQIGISRLEYDFPISKKDANELISNFCRDTIIEKTRHYLRFKDHIWEIDEFHKKNQGLVVAEIELNSENENFELPSWVEKEVTSEKKYYNMNLATNPYKNW
tara:strand:+ start:1165 stop:1629 length:465 start_codon:yes stop_codon:yes gene_type:complete